MLLEGDIIVIAARSIDFDESYMLVEEEVTKDTLEYGDTFIETKVDFMCHRNIETKVDFLCQA